LQFHSHDRFKLSFALLAGLTVAVLIKQFEAAADQTQAPAASLGPKAGLLSARGKAPGDGNTIYVLSAVPQDHYRTQHDG